MKPKRPISNLDWQLTPQPVREYVLYLERTVQELQESVDQLTQLVQEQGQIIQEQNKRIEKLEARLNKNSGNSNKPPSSDPPWQGPRKTSAPKKVR